ncbi:MAG TPA: isoleucine--tRNA ligase, partial [Candidatus Saccharimonadales bacterium]|nr:isoleucine--tRNA ligase [Candidatus Saccharimonadales bacterium]
MKFKSGQRRKPIEYEKDLVKYWKQHGTFEKSVQSRPADNAYVFYDGPPFITGVPHHGTLLSSVVKDAVPRYWTMKGKRVERVWGWDCHGLPAEVYTGKKLGIKDRREIGTSISLEDYIKACRANMTQTGSEWEDTIDRIGRWVDFKGAYKTMDKEYMERGWWAFKQLYDAGKIYEGEKVLLYCTHDATPLSKAEVAMDNSYQDDTDPSVYVKFKLKGHDAYLLAWTTTPWTLPSNTAIAVNEHLDYVEVEVDGQKLILAKDLLDKALTDEKHQVLPHKVLRTFKGKELVGKSYEPLFENRGTNAHKVWHAGFVHAEEGTGIAHESPAYGEDDYTLAKQNKVPMILDTDEEGHYTEGEWKGQLIWDVNKEIAKTLQERGMVWKIEYITHSYPHCHRCGTRLMYRAHPSWFMDIEGQRTEMLEENGNINWFPEHIKHGRFEKTVESAPDWNLSRDRFWATAMPVWKGVDKHGKEHIVVIGSYDELKQLSGVELEDYHRPWIDDVTFTISGIKYQRVDKVMDSWFEAGSMPFAQFHYPFENTEKFEANFPGDFIVEYVGQVRAWFYYLHAVGIGLFGKNAFSNVITTGTLAGNDGRKMSKSYGNYTDPNLLMDEYSADALRFLLMSSPLMNGEDYSLIDKDVADVHRKLAMIWNMYDFFTMYAEVDGWAWNGKLEDPIVEDSNLLDQWIV